MRLADYTKLAVADIMTLWELTGRKSWLTLSELVNQKPGRIFLAVWESHRKEFPTLLEYLRSGQARCLRSACENMSSYDRLAKEGNQSTTHD